MPSLTVGGTNVLTAITDLQSSSGVDSSTALDVSSLKATGAISTSSSTTCVEIGTNGGQAQARISSTWASIRLEGVGQSQSFTGFTLGRQQNGGGVTYAMIGTVAYQSWSPGVNTFHQQVILQQPLTFNTGPRLARTNDDSLEFYSGNAQAYKALTLAGSDGHVVAHIGFHNDSDATLKSNVVPASTAQALEILKVVEAKVYKRVDLKDDSPRLGFIAQDLEASFPPEWANIVGKTGGVDEHIDEEGNMVPARPSTLTLDYARLNCVLWECCRSLHARLEAIEARLQ